MAPTSSGAYVSFGARRGGTLSLPIYRSSSGEGQGPSPTHSPHLIKIRKAPAFRRVNTIEPQAPRRRQTKSAPQVAASRRTFAMRTPPIRRCRFHSTPHHRKRQRAVASAPASRRPHVGARRSRRHRCSTQSRRRVSASGPPAPYLGLTALSATALKLTPSSLLTVSTCSVAT